MNKSLLLIFIKKFNIKISKIIIKYFNDKKCIYLSLFGLFICRLNFFIKFDGSELLIVPIISTNFYKKLFINFFFF